RAATHGDDRDESERAQQVEKLVELFTHGRTPGAAPAAPRGRYNQIEIPPTIGITHGSAIRKPPTKIAVTSTIARSSGFWNCFFPSCTVVARSSPTAAAAAPARRSFIHTVCA